jgi:tetratricopeptide (TPR) repeat protein
LLCVVDCGIAGVLFIAPLFMGGRHPVGKLLFVALAGVTVVAWCARQCLAYEPRWIRSGAELLLLAGLGLIIGQITPLPRPLLLKLSPTLGELLPLWAADAEHAFRVGEWSQVSLTPHATRSALGLYLAYTSLFIVTVQRIQSSRDLERVVRWLAISAVAMALLGLAQFLFGNGKFLWIYAAPFRDATGAVKGPFHNENHFAHFLALGIGPLTWWWLRTGMHGHWHSATGVWQRVISSRSMKSFSALAFLPICLGVVVFAGLLTFSRGGVMAIFMAALVSVGLFSRLGLLEKRRQLLLAGICAVLGIGLSIFGYEPLREQLRTLEDARSMEELCRVRSALWESLAGVVPKFVLTGTGIGSHRPLYPTYLDEQFGVTFEYAESGYVQVVVETGVPGLVLLLAGIVLSVSWWLRLLRVKKGERSLLPGHPSIARGKSAVEALRLKACGAALLGGIVASVIHSFFDFVWYIPACMSLTVINLACLCRAGQLAREAGLFHSDRMALPVCLKSRMGAVKDSMNAQQVGLRIPRPIWIATTAVSLTVFILMIQYRLPAALASPHWDKYIRSVQKWEKQTAEGQNLDEHIHEMRTALEGSLRYNSHDGESHVKLAGVYLMQFDLEQHRSVNPMPLAQIRDAVWVSNFPSRESRDQWLSTALGPRRQLLDLARAHALQAIQLCPLQGEAYVYLAGLEFLSGFGPSIETEYVEQALRVRPYDGAVLVAAGGEAALAGDTAKALQLWKKAFHLDQRYQAQIIDILAPQVPAEFFLEQFAPDIEGLDRLYSYYRQRNLDKDARRIAEKYVESLERQGETETGEAAARLWHRAHTVHCFLGNGTHALRCLRQAVIGMPTNVDIRRTLAEQLLAEQQFDEAIREIRWCMRRSPRDASLWALLSEAHSRRLARAAAQRPQN